MIKIMMPTKQSSSPPESSALTPYLLKDFVFVVNKVSERINRQIESVTVTLGLNLKQYGLLMLLQNEGSLSQIVISQRVGLDRTSVMRTVDMLEARGLVHRDPDPTDRRKHSVTLTKAGEALLARSQTEVRQTEQDFAAALSEQEKAQLMSLLGRLLERGK